MTRVIAGLDGWLRDMRSLTQLPDGKYRFDQIVSERIHSDPSLRMNAVIPDGLSLGGRELVAILAERYGATAMTPEGCDMDIILSVPFAGHFTLSLFEIMHVAPPVLVLSIAAKVRACVDTLASAAVAEQERVTILRPIGNDT